MRSNDGTELENIGFDVYDNWTEGAVPHVIGMTASRERA